MKHTISKIIIMLICVLLPVDILASPLTNHGVTVSVCSVHSAVILAKQFKSTTGIIGNYTVRNVFISYLSLGLQAGYWNLTGKEERVKTITVAPLLCTIGLRIPVVSSFSLEPWIGTGGSYISTEAAPNTAELTMNGYTRETAFNFTCAGGGIIHWRPGHYFTINTGASYYSIFEDESRFDELVLSIGAGFRFGSSAGIEALKDEGQLTLKEQGNNYTINLIYARFDFNSTRLTAKLKKEIDKNISLFIEDDKNTYTIIGHSDRKGTSKIRREISIKRAEIVKDYIVSRYYIDPGKIRCRGKGATDPIVQENSKQAMAMNRRITIIIHTGE